MSRQNTNLLNFLLLEVVPTDTVSGSKAGKQCCKICVWKRQAYVPNIVIEKKTKRARDPFVVRAIGGVTNHRQ